MRAPAIRPPAVAGFFYPDDPGAVAAAVARRVRPPAAGPGATVAPIAALAAVCPHAGWQ
jgi:AmmeMemoRadiSam system protein B